MTATSSYLLLRALCDELARCGMRDACTSPGSRNTPVLLSLAREPRIHCWSHIDERCAGFFALGAAKATGRPVAVTCTSGTAAANLAPAVIEAFHGRVPLIILTADRPPELRDVGAGQTIDQVKLYGGAVKWFVEVGVHDADPARLRWIRALACRAYWTALGGQPGPVHLNLPLREPLVVDEPLPADPVPGRPGGAPWRARWEPGVAEMTTASSHPANPHPPSPHPANPHPAHPEIQDPAIQHPANPGVALPAAGVVVAGAGADGPRLAEFAARAGYPLLADPLSGARHGASAVARYDLLLRDPAFTGQHVPAVVLRAGDLPTSKPLRTWLAGLVDTPQIALDDRAAAHDPDAVLTGFMAGDGALPSLTPPGDGGPPSLTPPGDGAPWLQGWLDADDAASERIAATLGQELSEPLLAASLGRWLAPESTLFVASSMPIRDVELFLPARVPGPRVLANRGANGIDGTVSSAFGVAAACAGPVVLLIGDVALLHDIGGLLAADRLGLALTIVLINNDGGGIFHFLPVAGEQDAFETHVATPHGIDFARAAALYGAGYQRPRDLAELRAALSRAQTAPGTTILEVRTDRRTNLALHRRVAEAVNRPAPAASPRA
jgi:2-succinyl-5-enolpyruvyl-6-hydroxy-3-cyclohexene-1-carboxylate synthase